MTHTPGPWHATDVRNQKNGQIRIFADAAGYSQIANVLQANLQCEANASLIAASPELLEALETLFDITPFATNDKDAEIRMRVRAIIAKAKG